MNKSYECVDCSNKIDKFNAKYKENRCEICFKIYRKILGFKRCVKCGKPFFGYMFKGRMCRSCGNQGKRNPNYGNGDKILGFKNPNFGNGFKITGEKNPNWKGGIAKLPYKYDFFLIREYIRKRDKFTCQLCGIEEKNYRRALDVHHIDYDKNNNKETNLTTLCTSCNSKVNFGREAWKKYFQDKINKKYNNQS
jgi:DNA-directed RNA polymerase subunit RPC12/RpoP